jgi:ketosteroid isomerase-like protein
VTALEGRAREFFAAYGRGDLEATRDALTEDLTSYVTNAEGGADVVSGRDAYLGRLPDLHAAGGSVDVTQALEVDDERVLAMVEIRASRGGRDLHNHAAFLIRFSGGRIGELWMVDALPAYSAEFWS